jgi:hypothetical protein
MDLIQLIIFLILSFSFVWLGHRLCKRKGRDVVYAWLCIVPLVQIFVLIWLASLTDKEILERLALLEQKAA